MTNLIFRRPAKRCFLFRVSGQPVLLLSLDGSHLRAQGPVHPETRTRPAGEGGRRTGDRRTGTTLQRHSQRKRKSSKENC